MAPDEASLRGYLDGAEFLLGVADGRWGVLAEVSWPFVFIGVVAKDGATFPFRFDCSGYPHHATARLWDVNLNAPLAHDHWPKSRAGGRVREVFRTDWKNGEALYIPCDREAIVGHDDWRNKMPSKLWSPVRGLTLYLELIDELLHCSDYAPTVRAAS